MSDIRTALRLDALASGALGVLLVALAGVLDGPLGLPTALSLTVGALLVAWAALVAWVATRPTSALVKEIIVANVVYVAASLLFAAGGWVDLTGLGVAFVLVQAAAVVGLTLLQVTGLRTRETVSA